MTVTELSPTVRFAAAARTITRVCRTAGYQPPAFRSPPRIPGQDRSLRWLPQLDRCIVSVTIRGRPWEAVMCDMIEGAVAANRLDGALADSLRTQLWEALNDY